MFDDGLLVTMYVEYDVPCDRLVSNPETLATFAEDYANRTGQEVDRASLSHHMLNLRRRGQDKGGLPRLRRSYCGR